MNRFGFSCLLLASLAAGCGSGDSSATSGNFNNVNNPPATIQGRTITINQPALEQLIVNGERPDTVDVEGFDKVGQRIFGPVRVPLLASMSVPNVPAAVVRLELDYLRNGGFMLFRADAGVQDQNEVVPLVRLIEPNDTKFSVVPEGNGFAVNRELIGTEPSTAQISARGVEQVRIKGVCYSPSPINFSNKDAPSVGDLTWDSFKAGGVDDIFGWAALYLNFFDQNIGGNSRNDIGRIRDLGANTIRLYSCISYQLNTDGTFPNQATAHRHTHKAFLDACYNNNVKPLHVLVDIPMPDICFRNYLKEALDQPDGPLRVQTKAKRALEIAWWEDNLRATVQDLSSHPAVIGFNIMNEQDGADWSHPGQGTGPDNEETRYFYAQAVKYAGIVKGIDNTKLCGWAFHDSPDLVIFGSRFPASGPKYLEQLSNFDYWGINSYQTLNFDSVVGAGFRGSYADLPASMKKPVLLTELGWPATGHQGNQIVDNAAFQERTAAKIKEMYPQVYTNDLLMGACYFEYSDEWWKQPGGSNSVWNIGNPEANFPNGFWDEEGFGLFSVRRSGGRANDDRPFITFGPDETAPSGPKGPKNPYDTITARQPLIDELKKVFNSVP